MDNFEQLICDFENEKSEGNYNWRPWLPEDPVLAFVACVGAGPWKYNRRFNVQLEALKVAAQYKNYGKDPFFLQELVLKYPLQWQKDLIHNTFSGIRSVHNSDVLSNFEIFRDVCAEIKNNHNYVLMIKLSGAMFPKAVKNYKVVSLFMRDHLELNCFPVDRHVRSIMKIRGLPSNEADIMELFRQRGKEHLMLYVARWMGTTRLNGGNPNWSKISCYVQP